MRSGFSAYLSIFNDWDVLPDALRSIVPYIDEIVVVDGAYDWMEPYFKPLGVDPRESDPRVRAALEACGVPVRFINGVWKSEVEKRMVGYEACSGRFVFRIDADEILHFHDAPLERMLLSGAAAADMEMPVAAAPGLILASDTTTPIERQCLLFDKRQIGTAAHLRYLWLVLGTDELPQTGEHLPPVFPDPIAFNSHLTAWRTPATSVFRAAFYTLNYVRAHGAPWTAPARGDAVRDISLLLNEIVAPAVYRDLLLTGPLVVGGAEPAGKMLRRAPFGTGHDPRIGSLHQGFLDSLAELNRETAVAGRHFVNGDFVLIDLTTEAAASALVKGSTLTFEIPNQPAAVSAKIYYQLTEAPWERLQDVPNRSVGERLTLYLPAALPRKAFLRRILRLQVWCARPGPINVLGLVSP
jgi:hypothetical protein